MPAFLRTVASASAVVAVVATSTIPNPRRLSFSISTASLPSTSSSIGRLRCFGGATRNLAAATKSATHMDTLAGEVKSDEQRNGTLPELLTEFMVNMKCKGCVSAVKNKLQTLDGIKQVDVDLENQVVRVLGSTPVKTMEDAFQQTGRIARLIGQGSPEVFSISAAVAEFKGPTVFGIVRLAQVSMELARIEASFTGLPPGKRGLAINEFGDLTKGAASTGKVFDPPLGDLGTLEVQENGEANFSASKQMLRVSDLIGRSIVVYETKDKSDPGIVAAVIARSAGVGENYKKLCTCDGVTIWESN